MMGLTPRFVSREEHSNLANHLNPMPQARPARIGWPGVAHSWATQEALHRDTAAQNPPFVFLNVCPATREGVPPGRRWDDSLVLGLPSVMLCHPISMRRSDRHPGGQRLGRGSGSPWPVSLCFVHQPRPDSPPRLQISI